MADVDPPADTMRGRSDTSRPGSYLLVGADRRLVAGGLLAGTFLGLLAAAAVVPDEGAILRSGDPIETTFQAFVGATVTGVTLVLTLNQLVLSQELGAVGDQRDRMAGAMEFRTDVEDLLDEPASPVDPAALLGALMAAAADQARAVREATDPEPEIDGLPALLDGIEANAARTVAALEGARFGEFEVVDAALEFNYSYKLYGAGRLRNANADRLDGAAIEALDGLVAALRAFGPPREQFKTLYFQSELIDLSRTVVATALPALVVAVGTLAFVDGSTVRGSLLGVDALAWLVCLAVAIVLAPFAILLSYVLRIATVTRRTLSIGPFILRSTGPEFGDDDAALDGERDDEDGNGNRSGSVDPG